MAVLIEEGDTIRAEAHFFTNDDVDTDPTDVFCQVRDPLGNITEFDFSVDPEIIQDSTGHYSYEQQVTIPGVWYVRFRGEGIITQASEREFDVIAHHF